MEKKVALMLAAMALPIRVFPVPGGPKSSSPLGGALAPCTPSDWVVTVRLGHAWHLLTCLGRGCTCWMAVSRGRCMAGGFQGCSSTRTMSAVGMQGVLLTGCVWRGRAAHLEQVGVEHGPHDQLLHHALGPVLASDVVPGHGAAGAALQDLAAHHFQDLRLQAMQGLRQLSVRA